MISTEFTNITVELWFTWNGGNVWQRVFDWGDSNKGADPHVNSGGRDYIMFTPARGGNGNRTEFRATPDGAAYFSSFCDGPGVATTTNVEHHVVAEFCPALSYQALYVDGFLLQVNPTPAVGSGTNLSQLHDPNVWLGMSQYADPALNAKINELRLWEGLFNEVDVAVHRKAGPDATLPLAAPGTLQSISLQPIKSLHVGDATTLPVTLLGDFQNVTAVDITGLNGVAMQSSNTSIFTVTVPGNASPTVSGISAGTASLVATYQTFSSTTSVTVLAPTSISVTNLPLTVDQGSPTITVRLFANFADGSNNVDVTLFAGVTRSSSATNVATITTNGVITVLTNGTTTITSTYGGLTNQGLLTVLAPTSLIYTNLPATRDAGGVNFTVALFGIFSDGKTNNVTTATGVTHSSSDTNVATISGTGVVTSRNVGTTTITSTFGGQTVQGSLTLQTPANFVAGSLIHRYSFSEAVDATTVTDSIGGANGAVVNQGFGQTNGNFNGTGQFVFTGGPANATPITNSYINLPNRLISVLNSVTVEGWYTWTGNQWNRLFDFGTSNGSLDVTGTNYQEDIIGGSGIAYMFYTPYGTATQTPRITVSRNTGGIPNFTNNEFVAFSSGLGAISNSPTNKVHFAFVYDFPDGVCRLYINGQRAGTAAAAFPLSVVNDLNDYLGRSAYSGDGFFNGTIDEFRIYSGAFLDNQILAHFQAGADTLPVIVSSPQLSFTVGGGNITLTWPTNSGSFTLKSSSKVGVGALWNPAGSPTVVGPNYQVVVPIGTGNAYFRLEQ